MFVRYQSPKEKRTSSKVKSALRRATEMPIRYLPGKEQNMYHSTDRLKQRDRSAYLIVVAGGEAMGRRLVVLSRETEILI